ncbi:MAG: YhbY family RNA-binding protein [Spirochaetales bacterium]|nr:YhbY family RNA-binding protein [Spirochaetales bacterium]
MLTSKLRARLAGIAATLDPVVMLGRGGASDGVREALAAALDIHELVKLRFGDFQGEKKELARELAASTGSELVRVIGNVAVFWKRNPDPEKRKVALDDEPLVPEGKPRRHGGTEEEKKRSGGSRPGPRRKRGSK